MWEWYHKQELFAGHAQIQSALCLHIAGEEYVRDEEGARVRAAVHGNARRMAHPAVRAVATDHVAGCHRLFLAALHGAQRYLRVALRAHPWCGHADHLQPALDVCPALRQLPL